jgi:CRISPR-associated exonuclease Cas4
LAPIATPSLILATAIERLNARVIMAARHKNRNARALANLDALIERARRYGVAGLRAFVHDLQGDWERKVRVPEGRIERLRMRSRSSPSIAPKASNGPL